MRFEKTWGGYTGNIISYANELSNGDYMLIGGKRFISGGPTQNYACRISPEGEIIWENDWGLVGEPDGIGKVLALSDGTYLCVGSGGSGAGDISDMTLSNIDADGHVLFYKYYNFGYEDYSGDIIQSSDSTFVICGTAGTTTYHNPAFIKVDRSGNEIWRREQTIYQDYAPDAIKQSPDGGFIVLGLTGGGYNNCYYSKLSEAGDTQWIKYPFGLGDTIGNRPRELRMNADGSFDIYYGVYYTSGAPAQTILGLLASYDQTGTMLASKEYTVQLLNCGLSADSAFYGIENSSVLYEMDASGTLQRKVQLVENTLDLKEVSYFEKTSDGGYIGVGQYHPDGNTPRSFYVVKFGADGRYQTSGFLESLTAYPNPSRDGNITIRFETKTEEIVEVSVFTIDGQKIHSQQISCPANSHTELPVQLNLSSVSSGMYMLEVKTSGECIRQKLIVATGH